MIVEHNESQPQTMALVTVHEGGQAIVGDVSHGGGLTTKSNCNRAADSGNQPKVHDKRNGNAENDTHGAF